MRAVSDLCRKPAPPGVLNGNLSTPGTFLEKDSMPLMKKTRRSKKCQRGVGRHEQCPPPSFHVMANAGRTENVLDCGCQAHLITRRLYSSGLFAATISSRCSSGKCLRIGFSGGFPHVSSRTISIIQSLTRLRAASCHLESSESKPEPSS
ncbi:hypothetical protein BDZ45DRAFT_179474 [Acephala macrosclerotiorum]|nr:hypothetical protein BDZ45DRAFT_179474 [Acephala macrosclerotiorum]